MMKRRSFTVVLLCTMAGLVSTTVSGQTGSLLGPGLDERISVAFDNAAAPDILGFLARTKGLEAVVDPSLREKISFRLEHVKVRTALDALCDSLGCDWRLEGNKLVFEALPRAEAKPAALDSDEPLAPLRKVVPPGTHFSGVPLSSALQSLSRIAGPDVELTVDMVDANQRVSADVSSKTVQTAIRELVAASGMSAGKTYSITINRRGRKPTKIMTVLPGREPGPQSSAVPNDVLLECELAKDGQLVAQPRLKILSGEAGTISLEDLNCEVESNADRRSPSTACLPDSGCGKDDPTDAKAGGDRTRDGHGAGRQEYFS